MPGNDLHLLNKIQTFFGVGNITTNSNKNNGPVTYSVKSIVVINSIIIPQFYKYPPSVVAFAYEMILNFPYC